jgi:geranylgeranyl diphosphate synthase type II
MLQAPALNLSQYAERLRDRIDAALRSYTTLPGGCPSQLREAMQYGLLGPGKRLRPMLVLMAAEACGGTIEAAMPAACATEMIHAYSLVHDDLPAMDDDDLRRGRPTCHKQFGEGMAILAGDALLTLAFEILAKHVRPPETAVACCATLAEAAGACRMVGGQADDLTGQLGQADLESLESIHRRKTGAMMVAAIRLGALAAQADPDQMKALQTYGQCLGLAFQITDDVLDVQGDEAAVGKRVRKDSDRGKVTFPALLGVDQSIARARQLIERACEAIGYFGVKAASLDALARYVLERNR